MKAMTEPSASSRRLAVRDWSLSDGPNPDNETYRLPCSPAQVFGQASALRLIPMPSSPGADISRGSDRFVISEIDAAYSPMDTGPAKKDPFRSWPTAPCPDKRLSGEAVLDGNPKTGFGIVGRAKAPLLILRFAQPLHTSAESTLSVQHTSGFRLPSSHDRTIPRGPFERYVFVGRQRCAQNRNRENTDQADDKKATPDLRIRHKNIASTPDKTRTKSL